MKKIIAIAFAAAGAIGLAYAVAAYYLPIYGIDWIPDMPKATPKAVSKPVRESVWVDHARIPITIGESRFNAFLSDTESKRTNGLSGFSGLKADEAMLFVFPVSGMWGIWMKDMNFSIDIVWIDDERRVVSIKEGASPESYPEVFYPAAPARYVLEVPAGAASEHGILPGGKVDF